MVKINIYSISLGLAGLLFIFIIGMIVTGNIDKARFFILGFFLGYSYARPFKMSEEDARTIAIEMGMQNAGLASGIANGLGKIATMGLAAAVFGPLMKITGSILASYWHGKPTEKKLKPIIIEQ